MTNLEYLRRLSGLSQMQVAFKLKRHVSLISKLERGWVTRVPVDVARRLERLFPGWTLSKLLENHSPDETSISGGGRSWRLRRLGPGKCGPAHLLWDCAAFQCACDGSLELDLR
ncbi:MAG: helix-turn-helix domain-containing protein [Desulfomonilaceae bacterium]